MANDAVNKGAKILTFRPKQAKILPGIRKVMPAEKRRISQPVFLVPMKRKECAFRSSCIRECIEPARASFTDEIRAKLSLEIEYWLRSLNQLKNPDKKEFQEKSKYARRATWAMEGSVIPVGGEEGGGTNCLCGKAVPGTKSMKSMQAFTIEQMREVVDGMDFGLDLSGAYVSLKDGPVSGMHPDFAILLTRIANLNLPQDDSALKTLMMDGGLYGIRLISRMTAEPTVPHDARMSYVWAMDKLVSSAIFNSEKVEVINDYLALALSRFYTVEERINMIEGSPWSWVQTGHNLPTMGSKPNIPNLRQMISFSVSEFFQAIINMSARLGEIATSSKENMQQHQESAQSIYAGLKESIRLLAGKEQPNKRVLWEFCKRKTQEHQWDELDSGEQAMAKYVLRKMWGNGELETDSVDALLEVLNAEDVDAERYVRNLDLEQD